MASTTTLVLGALVAGGALYIYAQPKVPAEQAKPPPLVEPRPVISPVWSAKDPYSEDPVKWNMRPKFTNHHVMVGFGQYPAIR